MDSSSTYVIIGHSIYSTAALCFAAEIERKRPTKILSRRKQAERMGLNAGIRRTLCRLYRKSGCFNYRSFFHGCRARDLGAYRQLIPSRLHTQSAYDLLAQLTHQGPGFNYNKEHIVNTS
jgi:hypothetical protein